MTRRRRTGLNFASIFAVFLIFQCLSAGAEPQHGIAMYGKPALEPGFAHLPYANPDAPKGGRITFGESGGFDSLNPFIRKGRAPWGMRAHVYESLLGRSYDEPFALYGLLAESVEVPDDRSWVEFTLRPEARFSNGDPVTVEDVLWSFETLGTKGHPRYLTAWRKVDRAEITGPRSVRFTLSVPDRELPLILGLRPILRKADWEGRDFDESGLEPIHGSGPYILSDYEPDRFTTFVRNPDYWGWHLGFNAGRHNLDEIRYDYFTDAGVVFEAFKAGDTSVYREGNAARWLSAYDFPALRDGRVVKTEIPHQRPSGIRGFVMNTRHEKFKDWRVRDALILAFNFEFINQALNGGGQPRITSYFSNSVLGMRPGPAEGKVKALLDPWFGELVPGTLEGYSLPDGNAQGRNRRNLRAATQLLAEAGWTVQDGVLRDAQGQAFTIEVLLKNSELEQEAIMNLYASALERLGIELIVRPVDTVQHKERTDAYDFEMAYYVRYLSLSPGNEQLLYWGRDGLTRPGSRNWMGIDSLAAEAMIDAMLNARAQEDFVAAVRALDRILTAGRFVIPIWYAPKSLLAHDARLKHPETLPIYGDWTGFLPDVWWYE